ncbi:MAG: CRISPR system precrRNA processing endoribonuclease RAMP protein Cas6 [Caulobacteraceae bacterium]
MVPFLAFPFRFEKADGFVESRFPEAAWRGAFGYALKRTVCVMRLRPCVGCPFELSCAYPFIFETRPVPGASILREADRTPHPYVLRAVETDAPRSARWVDLAVTLIGEGVRHLPFVIHALDRAGRGGIGAARHVRTLTSVSDDMGRPIWNPGSELTPREAALPNVRPRKASRLVVNFDSPTRLVLRGRTVSAEKLDGPTLAFAAVRRMGLLRACFAGGAGGIDFEALKTSAGKVRIVDRELIWRDRRRYSTRQRRLISLGGFTGRATVDLADAPASAPFLETCRFVHLGKSATLGFGRISLADA